MGAAAPSEGVTQAPIAEAGPTLPLLAGPLRLLFDLTDRGMAPLAPMFTVLSGQWPGAMSPERILRSVLLMAVFGVGSAEALSERVARDPLCRRFLRLSEGQPALDPTAISVGQERLIRNGNAREAVGAIVMTLRSTGALLDPPFIENAGLVDAWTSDNRTAKAGKTSPAADGAQEAFAKGQA